MRWLSTVARILGTAAGAGLTWWMKRKPTQPVTQQEFNDMQRILREREEAARAEYEKIWASRQEEGK